MLIMLSFRLLSLVLFVLVIGLWHFLSIKGFFVIIPSPLAVYECFLANLNVLQVAIFDSLRRFFIGYILGAFLGVILGLILGRFRPLEILLEPFTQFLRPLSPLALLPLIVLIFGIGDIGAIFIIAYSVFFPILFLCISGVRNIPKQRLLMAQNFGANERLIFYHIILPSTFLSIASGLKLAAAIAFIQLVAAEMLGVQSGLGYMIIDGRNLLQVDYILVAIIVIGFLGFVLQILFSLLENFIKTRMGHK
ncbi:MULTISPECIES: ABC transporter permease [unclassified Campylobacter]|uniref:ABC transporter permease n=1 Tax=unclassified Campylobacter TaxID=2593542 RepID=UPI001237F580|nr:MULTISPECIES: ABC transporter permease [unclassified Campylobacter]KAA6225634.1 ABC transporter permease [Campylobacter sp. LR185c]KAA6228541.1 ABC transporter permease [Campylobacter sp. LR286c]KAA8603850.1 taurine ABC transporter permease [Campylobacter sp. LR185c]